MPKENQNKQSSLEALSPVLSIGLRCLVCNASFISKIDQLSWLSITLVFSLTKLIKIDRVSNSRNCIVKMLNRYSIS